MQDNNKKVIILIVLVVIAVFSIMRNLRAPYGGDGAVSDSSALTNRTEDIANLARTVKRSGFDTWKRSPFIPTDVAAREVPTLALSGIFWDEKKFTAIIDDEIVTVGDRIGDAVVVDIQKGFVRLNDGANDFELTLEEE